MWDNDEQDLSKIPSQEVRKWLARNLYPSTESLHGHYGDSIKAARTEARTILHFITEDDERLAAEAAKFSQLCANIYNTHSANLDKLANVQIPDILQLKDNAATIKRFLSVFCSIDNDNTASALACPEALAVLRRAPNETEKHFAMTSNTPYTLLSEVVDGGCCRNAIDILSMMLKRMAKDKDTAAEQFVTAVPDYDHFIGELSHDLSEILCPQAVRIFDSCIPSLGQRR